MRDGGRNEADSETIACAGQVGFTRLDGSALAVRFAMILFMTDGKITTYQLYADISSR